MDPTAGEELLGVIGDAKPDMPWFDGSWTPTQAFENFAPLFESELALMDVMDTDFERWEAAYREIRSAVDLRFPNGDLVPEFVLHIDDSRASFRWHDETFDN
jgi:hypothetical protein